MAILAKNPVQINTLSNFSRYKLVLADDLVALLNPIRLKIEDYLKNRDYLESVLRHGRDWATESAEKTMTEVRSRIGVKIL